MMLRPRARISPSGAIFTSTPSMGGPTVPGLTPSERRVVRHLLVHPRVHLLVEAGHGAHDGGADLPHVLRHLLDALRVGDGRSHVEHEVVAGGALEGVAEGEEGEAHVVGPETVHGL